MCLWHICGQHCNSKSLNYHKQIFKHIPTIYIYISISNYIFISVACTVFIFTEIFTKILIKSGAFRCIYLLVNLTKIFYFIYLKIILNLTSYYLFIYLLAKTSHSVTFIIINEFLLSTSFDFQFKFCHFHFFTFNLSLLLILQVGNLREFYAIFLSINLNSKSYFS